MWAGLNPAPATPLNVPIGPHRRFEVVRCELSDFKRVKDAFGGTVNDVVLTVVAGALRRWLRARGVRTEGLELRALVPVSIRAKDEQGSLGNRIAVMRGPLPVYIEDPVARLRVVKAAMDGLKESKQAVGAEVIAGVQQFAPPTVLAQASRLNFSTRLFNLIVTNVPGPQFPLYVLGRKLQDLFPIAFLPEDHALADRDHVLRRRPRLRPARRLRRAVRPRRLADSAMERTLESRSAGLGRALAADRCAAVLVPERELRVLGHLLRRPRRREDHRRDDLVDAVELARRTRSICSETCGPIGHAGVVSVKVTSTSPPRRPRRRRSGRARRSPARARGR